MTTLTPAHEANLSLMEVLSEPEPAQQIPHTGPEPMQAVPVKPEAASKGSYKTVTIATGGVAYKQLLPVDPGRRRAVVMAIDEPVVLCENREQATDSANQVALVPFPQGFYLPVNVPIPLESKSVVYVAATSSTVTRVSVVIERDDE